MSKVKTITSKKKPLIEFENTEERASSFSSVNLTELSEEEAKKEAEKKTIATGCKKVEIK